MYEDEAYFDFEVTEELPEKVDYSRTVCCPHCKKQIPHDSLLCFYCGQSVYRKGRGKTWIFWLSLLMLLVFLAVIIAK